jgi:hypothetical protein
MDEMSGLIFGSVGQFNSGANSVQEDITDWISLDWSWESFFYWRVSHIGSASRRANLRCVGILVLYYQQLIRNEQDATSSIEETFANQQCS